MGTTIPTRPRVIIGWRGGGGGDSGGGGDAGVMGDASTVGVGSRDVDAEASADAMPDGNDGDADATGELATDGDCTGLLDADVGA